MKKITAYILIIIALIGFLGSFTPINAAVPLSSKQAKTNYLNATKNLATALAVGTDQSIITKKLALDKAIADYTTAFGRAPDLTPLEIENIAKANVFVAKVYAPKQVTQAQNNLNNITNAVTNGTVIPAITPLTILPQTSQTPTTPPSTTSYHLLAPLPCPENTPGCTKKMINDFNTTGGLSNYLNPMIKIFIGLCAVLSVIMIIAGGIEYMTSELSHSKEAGKERIIQAILGLVIALGSWALLNTINPNLLNSEFKIDNATVVVPETETPTDRCSDPQYTTVEECERNGGTVD